MDERLVEAAVEIGGQAVSEVMVVEMQARATETFPNEKPFSSEDGRRVRLALLAHHLFDHSKLPPAPQPIPSLIDGPQARQSEVLILEQGSRQGEDIDVAAPDAGDRQTLVDCRIRHRLVRRDAGVLHAGQPLERDGGDEVEVFVEAGRGVVITGMNAQNIHRDPSRRPDF